MKPSAFCCFSNKLLMYFPHTFVSLPTKTNWYHDPKPCWTGQMANTQDPIQYFFKKNWSIVPSVLILGGTTAKCSCSRAIPVMKIYHNSVTSTTFGSWLAVSCAQFLRFRLPLTRLLPPICAPIYSWSESCTHPYIRETIVAGSETSEKNCCGVWHNILK